MQDAYKNIDEYNIDKDRKILIVFDDVIADMQIWLITKNYIQ